MGPMKRRPSLVQVAGATGLAIGLAVGGYSVAGAASGGSTTTAPATGGAPGAPRLKMARPGLAAAAKAIGISVADLQSELAAGKTIAAVATAHGVDPQKVIDAMVADAQAGLRQRITDEVNGTGGKFGPMRPGGPGGPGGFARGANLGVAAATIGISPADLQTALQSGQSIAAVAKAHNVDPQKVIDALVKDQTAKLDQAVKDGKMTQAQEDKLKAMLPQRVADAVNGVRPPRGFGPRHAAVPQAPDGQLPNGTSPGGAGAGPAPA